jgi:cytoskeletal protein CcmA (bactofilin family)
MGGKSGLLIVIACGLLLGAIALNLNRFATQSVGNMGMYSDLTTSHALAVSGANIALARFYQDTTWRGPIGQSLTGEPFWGSFTARAIDLDPDNLLLQSVSSYRATGGDMLHDTVEVYFKRRSLNSFSLFAWMTDFDGNTNWVTGDTIWGRMHSNGAIHINGKPVFMGKVTTAKGFDPKPGVGTNKAIFKNSYETGVAPIDFPTDLSEIITASTTGGRRYSGDIWITLEPGTAANNDGWAVIRSSETGPVIDSVDLSASGFNGVILGDGRVNVEGTVDGVLSIASLTDVYIQNDVLYERDPRAGTSDDLLGIVADANVVIANNSDNNKDCVVQGCIFARTGSFSAESHSTRGPSGILDVYGSIVQKTRGMEASYSGSSLKSGFYKRYVYDTRLEDASVRPPSYPGYYVKTFAIANWWENYRVSQLY